MHLIFGKFEIKIGLEVLFMLFVAYCLHVIATSV